MATAMTDTDLKAAIRVVMGNRISSGMLADYQDIKDDILAGKCDAEIVKGMSTLDTAIAVGQMRERVAALEGELWRMVAWHADNDTRRCGDEPCSFCTPARKLLGVVP